MLRLTATVITVAVLVAGSGIALSKTSGSQSHSPRFTAAEVLEAARNVGRREGDPRPTDISDVGSTWGKAVPVVTLGRANIAEEPALRVQVITMHGHFTMYTAAPPRRTPYPRNRWLTLTVDAKTGEIRETNLGNRRPPLERLGAVRHVASS